jgi:hypothetical protein
MGYSTDFVGQFDCYHVETDQIGTFLKAIYAGDRASLAVLGDWLSDHGDPRGERIASFVFKRTTELTEFWRLFGLKPAHAAYLRAFNDTRRMRRDADRAQRLADPIREAVGLPIGIEAGYFVGGTGPGGQDRDDSIMDYNQPPSGQPGLWCKWTPNEDGTGLVWDGAEKFYDYIEWLEYLIKHFLAPWGYVLNGRVDWQGEETADRGSIIVEQNRVETALRERELVHPLRRFFGGLFGMGRR